ncbi:hypothetical protein RHMOL_Rhmol10G0179500 [Rhododendron molle]|uniref:Uncharacterized protein n=1 Tax=Rhododendron molle TaxID=49168 RepID=A0ACC0M407_RHOML|nr:hypothetical protein RHMOL_Rhmol10G0179500 [Rhododendron molle]
MAFSVSTTPWHLSVSHFRPKHFPSTSSTSSPAKITLRLALCHAAKKQGGPPVRTNKKKKKKKKLGGGRRDGSRGLSLDDVEYEDDDDDNDDGEWGGSSRKIITPPAGFVVDDDDKVLMVSDKRIVTVQLPPATTTTLLLRRGDDHEDDLLRLCESQIDSTHGQVDSNNLPLECIIRRVFRSAQGEECMLLCPADMPVRIVKSKNMEGLSSSNYDSVDRGGSHGSFPPCCSGCCILGLLSQSQSGLPVYGQTRSKSHLRSPPSSPFQKSPSLSPSPEVDSQVDCKGSRSDEEFGFRRNPVENQFSRQPWLKHSGASLESIRLRCLLVLNPPKKSSERLGLEAHLRDPNLPFAECGQELCGGINITSVSLECCLALVTLRWFFARSVTLMILKLVSVEEVKGLLPTVAYALAKVHMHLVHSGLAYVNSDFASLLSLAPKKPQPNPIGISKDGEDADGLPNEGIEITSFNVVSFLAVLCRSTGKGCDCLDSIRGYGFE